MNPKPSHVFHGSSHKISGALTPVLVSSEDHIHTEPAVFVTENMAIASLFMCPPDALSSIGFEQGIAYICIWGTPEEFKKKDRGGYLYVLPTETFEKRGKEYEWQSRVPILPDEIKFFPSVLDGMKQLGARIYFINDDHLFDLIQAHKNSRLEILKDVPFDQQ
jgi:hypothetical protein